MPTALIRASDVRSFIDHATQLAAGAPGALTPAEFLNIMPMRDDQRAIIERSFPQDFAVSCADGECQAEVHGRAAQATMHITIPDAKPVSITNPTLALASVVTTGFVLRGPNAIEFCGVKGMQVKKYFLSHWVQGIYLELVNGQPHEIVNIDDDQAYTCQ